MARLYPRPVDATDDCECLVAGDVVVAFDVSGDALQGGRTSVESAGADPSVDDDVEVVLDGCFDQVRVALSGAPFAPPTLVETTTEQGAEADVLAPPDAQHLLDCTATNGYSTSCCPLPLDGARIEVEAADGVHGIVKAVRGDGEHETAAGTLRVWRETGAHTSCCESH